MPTHRRSPVVIAVTIAALVAAVTCAVPAAQAGRPPGGQTPPERPTATSKPQPGTWSRMDGTGPLTAADPPRSEPGRPARSRDVGDVAVIEDPGTIVRPPAPDHPFDLSLPARFEMTPTTDGFAIDGATASPVAAGTDLALGDDDTTTVALPFSFPFRGTAYDDVHVNSDGTLTFDTGDAGPFRDVTALVSGPPRIAAWFTDLDPTAGGSITADVGATEATIAWRDVPRYGQPDHNTFAVTLRDDGTVALDYQRIDAPYGIVGVAEGGGAEPVTTLDLSDDLPTTVSLGTAYEEFAPSSGLPTFDATAAAQAFYDTHDDRYDFLVVFTDVPADLGGNTFAFNRRVRNDTLGLGLPVFDRTAEHGSAGELESVLAMNNIHLYWPTEQRMVDPPVQRYPDYAFEDGIVFDRGSLIGTDDGLYGSNVGRLTFALTSPMALLAHEVGHRWLASPQFVHPETGVGDDSDDLLGELGVHWSWFLDTSVPAEQFADGPRASALQGNAIRDVGDDDGPCAAQGSDRFETPANELTDGYSALDQYFMGVRSADDVEPFFYVDEPTSITGSDIEGLAPLFPISGATWCGTRVDLSVDDIVDHPAMGPRVPAFGDEDDTGTGVDVKTMAFVLVVSGESEAAEADAVNRVEAFRRAWNVYGNGEATGGRGVFDTSLDPAVG